MKPLAMRFVVTAMLTVAWMVLLAVPAHAAGSKLTIQATMSDAFRVSIEGSLLDDRGKPIKQAPVHASIDGQQVTSTRSRGNGKVSMSFDVPANLRSGNRRLIVKFDGDGRHGPAQSSVTLAMGAPPPRQPSQPTQPPPAPPPEGAQPNPTPAQPGQPGQPNEPGELDQPEASDSSRPDTAADADGAQTTAPPAPTTQLQVTPSSTTPVNGGVVELTGQLIAPDGQALADAEILLFDDAGEVDYAFALTNDEGKFETIYEVAEDRRDPVTITLKFPGSGSWPAAEAAIPLEVRYRPPTSETPSPSPTPSASEESAAPAVSLAEETPSGEAAPDTPAEAPDTSASWLTGALIAVGAVTLVAAGAGVVGMKVMRAKAKVPAAPVESGLTFFDEPAAEVDDAPPPAKPRRGAF